MNKFFLLSIFLVNFFLLEGQEIRKDFSFQGYVKYLPSYIGYSDNDSWVGELTLTQYSKDGDSLMTWKFIDCWPQTVAEIALSYDTASDIEQFDVTWAYNYYTSAKGSSSHIDSTFARQG